MTKQELWRRLTEANPRFLEKKVKMSRDSLEKLVHHAHDVGVNHVGSAKPGDMGDLFSQLFGGGKQ